MQIQTPLEKQLTELDGSPMFVGEHRVIGNQLVTVKTDKVWTFGSAIINVLTSEHEQEQPKPDGLEKAKRGHLAMKLYDQKTGLFELEAGDIETIKRLAGYAYTPLMVARLHDMLEAKPRQETDEAEASE